MATIPDFPSFRVWPGTQDATLPWAQVIGMPLRPFGALGPLDPGSEDSDTTVYDLLPFSTSVVSP